jgi:uncharacterized protein (TIGR03437 family)
MIRKIRYAVSGIKPILFFTLFGCLSLTVLVGAAIRPAFAAREDSTRPGAPQDHSPRVQVVSAAKAPPAESQRRPGGAPLEGGSAIELRDGKMSCRVMTKVEAQALGRATGQQLRVLGGGEARLVSAGPNSAPEQARKGLKIVLRGTPQLEQYPEAKAAFLRAAAVWESLIQNPITVVVDVDFGPTLFGEPFPDNLLSVTHFQRDFDSEIYPTIRSALIRSAGSPREAALYNTLPTAQLPTDVGATTGLIYHSAVMRALGLFPPVADPAGEQESLGRPPSVAFDSTEDFDFDPSDGINPQQYDFTALATHEIGHALGFFSGVGLQELYPTAPPQMPEVLDMFRFRPEVTSETFAATPRILSSGGDHVFFGGGVELPLSTGRSNYTGGDGQQAGHWKDEDLIGRYIGIMHPVFSPGGHYEMTANDLEAFERIGYRMNPLPNPQEPELTLDDGAIDNGTIADGLMVVNRLTPPSYPATLRKLRVMVPILINQPNATGKPITLLIYAQGDPAGQLPPGAKFTRIETIVPSAGNNLFLEFEIPNGPTINAGDFYVGYQAPAPHQGVGFAADLSGAAENRSFYSTDGGASFRPFSEIYQGKAASAMIRAIVYTPGSAPSDKAVSVSAASYDGSSLAGESIVAAFGARLATTVSEAGDPGCSTCLPTELAGTRVMVKDSAGAQRPAKLFFVSPGQVNYLMPEGLAAGAATVTVTGGDGAVSIGTAQIATVAPGLFTANGDGQGAPSALALRVKPGADPGYEPVAQYDSAQRRFTALPIDLGAPTENVFLILFATGLRHRQSLSTVGVRVGGIAVPVQYAGAQGGFSGLDQVNAVLPRSLIGRGEVDVVLTVDGRESNRVRISIK